EEGRSREWRVSKVFVRRGRPGRLTGRLRRRRRGEAFIVDYEDLTDIGIVEQRQGAANLLAAFEELKAPDLAEVIHELAPRRRIEVASALDDERLADVLEELPDDDQVEILSELGTERAAEGREAGGRRGRPAVRAAEGAGRAASGTDGAVRGGRRAPPAGLRRRHRRRPDDA